MGRLLNIVTPLHTATKRDYMARMNDDKIGCSLKAREYEADIGMATAASATADTASSRGAGRRSPRR
ncbi:hypothetical protein [Bradyrhizobium sp. RDT46]|uniref:hypothetical protein n=1 Tax=Bradyrhizobium sp. RDT46 TaxID=3341829 RepID=UPI0035C717AB